MDKKITYKAKDNDLLYVVDEATGEIDYNHSETKMDMHKLHLWHNEAALFIINKQGKILLQKRSQNVHFNKGKWGMVANHPNINQTIVESVVEKAKEEIGLTIDPSAIMFFTLAKRDDENKNKYAYFYYYKADIKDKDLNIEPYLATEYKWWDFYELQEKMLTNSHDTVFKNIPFYVYVFKQLEQIIKGINTNKAIRYKEFMIAETRDKVSLPCVLYRPKQKTKNVAIFVHGSGGNFFKQTYLNDFINRLTYGGCAYLSTNNRGAEQEVNLYKINGEKYERFKAGSKYENFEESELDIEAYINLVKSQGFKNIILIGHSLGTLKVLNYALKHKEINKVILVSPVDMVFRFRERVKDKFDYYIDLAKQKLEEGKPYEMLTSEFSALKIYTTFRYGGLGDTLAIEEHRLQRVLDYSGFIRIIKGTSDHVYGNYSTEYVDNAFKNEFKNANLKIVNITNANHAFKGYEKQCATYLFDAVNDLINIK